MSDFDERDASDDEPELNEEEVLEQLQELHRQLAERQKDEEVTPSLLEPPKKLIICATRRPVRLEKPFGEASFQYEESKSGLTSAVNALQNDGVECRWVAWPGCAVEKTSQEGVRQRLEDDFNCRPVFLERDLVEAFYARFCHGVLWPLFHSLPTDVTGRTDLYEAYVQANQKYLEAVALEYQEGDVVLVHDYELMLLPAMIRGRFPDAPVGFFCHCPYENSVLYTRGRVDGVEGSLPSRRQRVAAERRERDGVGAVDATRTQVPILRILPHAARARGVAARRPRCGPHLLQPF